MVVKVANAIRALSVGISLAASLFASQVARGQHLGHQGVAGAGNQAPSQPVRPIPPARTLIAEPRIVNAPARPQLPTSFSSFSPHLQAQQAMLFQAPAHTGFNLHSRIFGVGAPAGLGLWNRPVRPGHQLRLFYPIGFGSFAAYGYSGCDPVWTWRGGCNAFGYTGYYPLPKEERLIYPLPAEPAYFEPISSASNASVDRSETLIYFKDGSLYLISTYRIADGNIIYSTSDGMEHVIHLSDVDLQQTASANAKRGVTFPAPATSGDATNNGSNDGRAAAPPH